MKKLTFEEKQNRRKQKAREKIAAMPVLGMAYHVMGNIATIKLQVVKLTKYSVTMRTIGGGGTITIGTTNKRPISEIVKIELVPCNTTPAIIKDGITTEIPQLTECGL